MFTIGRMEILGNTAFEIVFPLPSIIINLYTTFRKDITLMLVINFKRFQVYGI